MQVHQVGFLMDASQITPATGRYPGQLILVPD